MTAWNASVPTGEVEPGWPAIVNDLQFFTPPSIADVDGDGRAEAIQSTSVGDTVAVGLEGGDATVIRHFTGGWTVAAATVGDAPLGDADDDRLQLTDVTREGYLRLWPTPIATDTDVACAALTEWPEYGHDAANSGNYGVDAERPAPVGDLQVASRGTTATLTFTATGDDRRCGLADHYEVRVARGDSASWHAATPVATDVPVGGPAGTPEEVSVNLGTRGRATVLVRAVDDVGNGSALRTATVGPAGGRPEDPGPPDGRGRPGAGESGGAHVAAGTDTTVSAPAGATPGARAAATQPVSTPARDQGFVPFLVLLATLALVLGRRRTVPG